jgi:XapX domain-containing protein
MKLVIGLVLGFIIGALCNVFAIPVPAPPVIEGALLVVAMTLGYGVVDRFVKAPATTKHQCGGPSGVEKENIDD